MASMVGRRTIVCILCRASTNSAPRRPSFASSLRNSNFTHPRPPVVQPSPLRLLRRELSSFKPLHSAIASAYLVSKLPCDAYPSSEGKFVNYISPI
ncbi:hypothetical protein K1719_023906 [Acacia pycnantha]|nr:hypothetical protein K1719_023906 [Acacia pycnantha]